MKTIQTKINVNNIKKDFPIFNRIINENKIIYLDSAATSQRPQQVIQAMKNFYENYNSNIHRGVYKISEEATIAYEEAHKKVENFINADESEVIFTKNTTESLNLAAYSLLLDLKKDDEIVISEMEHHSNLVPWQQLSKLKGIKLRYIPVNKNGILEYKDIINKKTKIVSLTHISNSIGTINPIKEIIKIAHENNALTVIDGAQAAPHMPVDMKDLDVDLYAFSGHKMLGPMGSGVLYGKKEVLEKMRPFQYGGDMIKEVSYENTTFNDLPWKFEAGTPNVSAGIGLGIAVDYLNKIGMENIRDHEIELKKYALKLFEDIKNVNIIGPKDTKESAGIISFTMKNTHPHDASSILDKYGICIRGGHHCTMPLMKKFGLNGTSRASFYIYNDTSDIDKLKDGLEKVQEIFQ